MRKLLVVVLGLLCSWGTFAQQRPVPPLGDLRWNDSRFCGFPIPRDADGSIHRSATVLKRFQEIWPCPDPVTTVVAGKPHTTCPTWALDHPVPLVCGGCDAVHNLQWLKLTVKSCAGTECKDRWEQRVYCRK